jgi:hypothetical protein
MHHSKKNRARPQSGTVGAFIGADAAVVKQNARFFRENLAIPLWRKIVKGDEQKSLSEAHRTQSLLSF